MPLSSVLGAQSLVRPGVCTSSTRPASPFEGQVIYETDTDKVLVYDGSAWYAPENTAWGQMATAQSTSAQTGISTETDLTSLTVTFTAVTGRMYQAFFTVNPYGTSGEVGNVFLNIGGTNVLTVRSNFAATNKFSTLTAHHYFTQSSGSVTVKLRMAKVDTNNVNNYADGDFKCRLTVFDVGPA